MIVIMIVIMIMIVVIVFVNWLQWKETTIDLLGTTGALPYIPVVVSFSLLLLSSLSVSAVFRLVVVRNFRIVAPREERWTVWPEE